MDHLIYSAIVQGTCLSPESWNTFCSFWNWAFWVAFFLGIVGAGISFFTRAVD